MFGLQKKTLEKDQVANGVTHRQDELTLRPAVDITETEAGYTIYADVPGASKEHVNVTFENGIVTLKTTAQSASEQKTEQTLHREFRRAGYERSFRVSEDVDAEAINAEIANGVLKVSLPRKASAKKTITVAAK